MNAALIVFNLVLAGAVLALALVCLALARQIGVLHERIAPMGALMMESGPKVGDRAPALDLVTLQGQSLLLGRPTSHSQLLFFLSPACPVCKKLLPILQSIQRVEAGWLDLVLASDGDPAQHEVFRRKAGLLETPYLLSADLGLAFRVSKLPYAVLLDAAGRVRAKGLVNSREQIESLFAASELGVASIQQFLDGPDAPHAQAAA